MPGRERVAIDDVGLPKYSVEGLDNRDLFLADSNEILIYFEDANWEEFYLSLLEKLQIHGRVETVFCLGGKGRLIEKIRQAPEDGKRRLFVFDKDFDDLLGCVTDSVEVAYLGRYSIENYFFSTPCAVRFVVSQVKGLRRAAAERCFQDDQIESFLSWYTEVCRYFVVAQKFRLGIESIKVPLCDLANLPSGERKDDWWQNYCARFAERVRLVQPHLQTGNRLERELAKAFDPVKGREGIADGSDYCHLPGKHLLEFLLSRISVFLPKIDLEDIRYRLMMSSIAHLAVTEVDEISRRLRTVLDR